MRTSEFIHAFEPGSTQTSENYHHVLEVVVHTPCPKCGLRKGFWCRSSFHSGGLWDRPAFGAHTERAALYDMIPEEHRRSADQYDPNDPREQEFDRMVTQLCNKR
jgi:hypothetical protein